MGRTKFSEKEIKEIGRLLRLKNAGNRAQQKHDIVPLVAQKADKAVGFLVILHISTSEHKYRQAEKFLYQKFLDLFLALPPLYS